MCKYWYISLRADHVQQFPGVLNRNATDVEEAIYNKSRTEVSLCVYMRASVICIK